MPKIRGIKPDYWTDEDVVELSIPARLLFIGLWNYACDNGHLADKSRQIKMRILPGDDVNAAELLREIEAQGLIERADGWITIRSLTRHQRVDRRYFTTCTAPGCTSPETTEPEHKTRRAPSVTSKSTRRAPAVHPPGTRVDGDGDGDSSSSPPPRTPPPATASGGTRETKTSPRQLTADLLGIPNTDPRLDHLPQILKGVRTPGPWLRATAAAGDLENLVNTAAEASRDPWAHLPRLDDPNPSPATARRTP